MQWLNTNILKSRATALPLTSKSRFTTTGRWLGHLSAVES